MKITLRLNHGATEVHKSRLASLSAPPCQNPRAPGIELGKRELPRAVGCRSVKSENLQGQTDSDPLWETPSLEGVSA